MATMALVAVTILAYVGMLMAMRDGGSKAAAELITRFGLSRSQFELWQPVTYQFVHDPDSPWHLVGNMLFLWVFGSAVESRFRWLGFVIFYLAGGIVAGVMEILVAPGAAVIGASGAVSAVTGAFIVLFPRAKVSVFFLLSLVPVPAMLLVALYLALDILGAIGVRGGGVAYMAHIAGLAFGAGLSGALLWLRLVRRTDFDLVYLIKQWRRRAEMRAALRSNPAKPVWSGQPPPTPAPAPSAPRVEAKPAPPTPSPAMAARWLEAGSAAYSRGEFAKAAELYERGLVAAPDAKDADQTRLMLAVIHARKLKAHAKAREFLAAMGPGLPEHLRELAEAVRYEVRV